jgi:hypothetical protein
MSALDKFVDGLQAAGAPDAARFFAGIFHNLRAGDDPGVIDLHDEITSIVSRRSSLQDRLTAIYRIKE